MTPYPAEFSRLRKKLCGADLPWVREMRESAIARFEELGFPTRRDEDWRNTDVTPIARTEFEFRLEAPAVDPKRVEAASLGSIPACRLVFVDGLFSKDLSQRACGMSLATTMEDAEPHLGKIADGHLNAFAALNTAFFHDGALIELPKGFDAPDPIHLLFISTANGHPVVSYPRLLIVAGKGACADIVEEYVGFGSVPTFTNVVVEIVLGENARVDHTKLQREPVNAYHMATIAVRLGRHSRFTSHSISLGGGRTRNDIMVLMDSEGAECSLDGLYRVAGEQLVDHHTTIDHASPHTTSRQLFKGILDDRARGVFNGRVIVRPHAQKTDAIQANRNLLLSKTALVNSNPQLEILANDVKCKHGSSIGQISEDEIFYLRSRGIDKAQAWRMLVTAFGEEIIDRLKVDAIRAALSCEMAVQG